MNQDKKKILCVEDDEEICIMLTEILSRFDFEVKSARTIADGVGMARQNRFDLYLIDCQFPDGKGLDLLLKLRSFDSQTPILIYTGDATQSFRETALKAGAQAYVIKPYGLDEIELIINKLLNGNH